MSFGDSNSPAIRMKVAWSLKHLGLGDFTRFALIPIVRNMATFPKSSMILYNLGYPMGLY